jgi:hypothetical protein
MSCLMCTGFNLRIIIKFKQRLKITSLKSVHLIALGFLFTVTGPGTPWFGFLQKATKVNKINPNYTPNIYGKIKI